MNSNTLMLIRTALGVVLLLLVLAIGEWRSRQREKRERQRLNALTRQRYPLDWVRPAKPHETHFNLVGTYEGGIGREILYHPRLPLPPKKPSPRAGWDRDTAIR